MVDDLRMVASKERGSLEVISCGLHETVARDEGNQQSDEEI
jgi:hypothetical protein